MITCEPREPEKEKKVLDRKVVLEKSNNWESQDHYQVS